MNTISRHGLTLAATGLLAATSIARADAMTSMGGYEMALGVTVAIPVIVAVCAIPSMIVLTRQIRSVEPVANRASTLFVATTTLLAFLTVALGGTHMAVELATPRIIYAGESPIRTAVFWPMVASLALAVALAAFVCIQSVRAVRKVW